MLSTQSSASDLLADEPDHGIPCVTSLDVHSVWKHGGSDLHIIIAKPLEIDERTRERLMAKLENYLNFINTPEYAAQCGHPTPENTRVVVSLHPDMNPAVEATLIHCVAWIKSNNATLKVQHLDSELNPPAAH
jgi:hypothetical protein